MGATHGGLRLNSANAQKFWVASCCFDVAAIRQDVQAAILKVWKHVSEETRRFLGDSSETATLMEKAAAQTSVYLDRIQQEISTERASAVLMRAFGRLLMRSAIQTQRFQPLGKEVEALSFIPSFEQEVLTRIFLEKLASRLSQEGVTILNLRRPGYSWYEIAEMLQVSVATVKKRFWREVEDAKTSLGITEKKKPKGHRQTRKGKKILGSR